MKMSSKTKKIIFVFLISVVYYIILFNFKFTVSEQLTLTPANYKINENCIIVHGQATTGPEIRVVQGSEFLLTQIPLPHLDDLNVNEIEMTGKSIYYGGLGYPDYYACNWLVYGKVVDTTNIYEICGSGTIPVFEAEKVCPVMTLGDFLLLEAIMFEKLPIGLFLAFLLYFLPLIIIFIVQLYKDIRHKYKKY